MKSEPIINANDGVHVVSVDGASVSVCVAGAFRHDVQCSAFSRVWSSNIVLFDCDNIHEPALVDMAAAFMAGKRVALCGDVYSQYDRLAAVVGGNDEPVIRMNLVPLESAIVLSALVAHHDASSHVRTLVGDCWGAGDNLSLALCESPVERRLALHLMSATAFFHDVRLQVPATTPSGNFRLDAAVIDSSYREGESPRYRIAVEVDGHDFHERTKEQAKRDKSRDRALTAAGWRVLRFTGSEVWNNPHKCADEIYEIAERLEEECQ